MVKTLYITKRINYSGKELEPHWIYRNFNIMGDAVIAFCGEANVPQSFMLDQTDILDKAYIYSPLMLHFIIEHFDNDLSLALYRQRLFLIGIKDELEQLGIPIVRRVEALYAKNRKLTVSVASSSNVSTLVHTGINIETDDTPVKTAGLAELGVNDIQSFAENVMLRYQVELEQIYDARCRIRGIVAGHSPHGSIKIEPEST
ncbi:MAG TPA: DUF366 family protein [Gelria sp.]|nr:DUF366 family protein [Gelria sp.]